jgi:hypothetical protein
VASVQWAAHAPAAAIENVGVLYRGTDVSMAEKPWIVRMS